jgi:diguanylate cyclase (GGDEF)-like protein
MAIQPSAVVQTIDKLFPKPSDPQFVLRAEHSPQVVTVLNLIDQVPFECLATLSSADQLLLTLARTVTAAMVEQWKTVSDTMRRINGGPGLGVRPELDGQHPIALFHAILAKAPEVDLERGPAPRRDPATLDALTQLRNRGRYDSDLVTLVQTRQDRPLGYVMVDVDHFKSVNDKHGHDGGDAVLREVAARLETIVIGKGFAYRYGGEEMVLLLPNHSTDEALAVAERARRSIEGSPAAGVKVTASFGVASMPEQASDALTLAKRADEAVYDAKKRGRNLVRFSGEPEPQDGVKSFKTNRRAPEPGGLTEAQGEKMRADILVHGLKPRCPSDNALLEVIDFSPYGSNAKEFMVNCPMCGWSVDLKPPER